MSNVTFEGEHIPRNKLPIPAGFRLLIGMIKVEETTNGGIVLVEEYRQGREYLRSIGKVLAVGKDAYYHPKFQGGVDVQEATPEPWVKVGDIVCIGQYAGQAMTLLDKDGNTHTVKLLNDDAVLAIIPDISAIDLG